METREAIYKRQSIRHFSDQAIQEKVLEEIVKDAQRAPSWANSQPGHVYIATGSALKEIKKRHLEKSQRGISGNSDLETTHRNTWSVEAQTNMGNWSRFVSQRLQEEHSPVFAFQDAQFNLFNSAAIVYLTLPKNANGWSLYDLGAFGQTLMLSAIDRGIQSMPAYELVKYPKDLRETMGIPGSEMIVMGIGLGFPDNSGINRIYTKRSEIDKILTIKK